MGLSVTITTFKVTSSNPNYESLFVQYTQTSSVDRVQRLCIIRKTYLFNYVNLDIITETIR